MNLDLEKLVKEQIANLDIEQMVREEIRKLISEDSKRKIFKMVDEKVKEMIANEITIQLDKPIMTDDGFGRRENYPDFETLFRTAIIKRMNESWEVKRTIENIVKNRVDDLFKNKQKEVAAKMAEELLKQ